MAGASRNHNRITLNAAVLLSGPGDGSCEAYSSDMRVKLSDYGAYAYPDVVVACGPLVSLRDYVLISQDAYVVEHFSRGADGRWSLTDARSLKATLELPSLGCQLELRRIYARVGLAPVDSTGPGLGDGRPREGDSTP